MPRGYRAFCCVSTKAKANLTTTETLWCTGEPGSNTSPGTLRCLVRCRAAHPPGAAPLTPHIRPDAFPVVRAAGHAAVDRPVDSSLLSASALSVKIPFLDP